MSDQGIDAAVEQILADQAYAKEVYQNPQQALTSRFDLDPPEWRSIAWALRKDVEDSIGDVSGHGPPTLNFGLVEFRTIRRVPALKGSIDRAGDDVPTGFRP
ncbi:MAG: hypothetical protein ACRDJE_15715 [Dehalococcoidia bacterium]